MDLVILALSLTLTAIALSTSSSDESFSKAARSFQAVAVKGDVANILPLCTVELECLEYRYVFSGEYSSSDKELFTVPIDDDTYRHRVVSQTVRTTDIDAKGKKLILTFFQLMKDSLEVYGIDVLQQVDANMLIPVSGGGLRAKIASNAQWRVDFRQENGKWLAHRLIVGVH